MNVKKLEFNKPSEFCQLLYFENYKKTIFAQLTPTQIDLINILVYKVREQLIRNKEVVDYSQSSHKINLELKDIATMLDKYKHNNYDKLIDQLNGLRKLDIVINVLGKNKEMETTLTSFIHEITISRHHTNNKKIVSVYISNKVLEFFIDVKKLFSKFFLVIQFSMHSKYSKLLYELLKDYEGIKTKTIDYDLLVGLINATGNSRAQAFSYFNNDVLRKAVSEINEKSDIHVSYEPIKERPDGQRLQVTKIKFHIEKQPDTRLQELGLIQPSIETHKFYNKSKTKLDALVKNGYTMFDEEMWIETDIKKNEERYDAETRIDVWLAETSQEDKNMIYEQLAQTIDECDDPMVIIEDYLVRGVFSKDSFTRNPIETITILNTLITSFI